ncbi:hypothetical protein HK104_009353 [Borealophlyctis nickersoniae]|nr:hypothetical protein HK104_009353 [Borealophlyctis nickersoniae]
MALTILNPPDGFGIIEPGVYRSHALQPTNFPFLQTLNLKTVLVLSPDPPSKSVNSYVEDNGIKMLHLGSQASRPNLGWRPVSEELVKDGLELVLNVDCHPIMVMDASPAQDTGTFVGCLRKLQGWNFNTIVVEYRSVAGSKSRTMNEQFMELFDTDLVTLPRNLPSWLAFTNKCMQEEEEAAAEREAAAEAQARTVANI